MSYETKSSDQQQTFDSGAQRDTREGKGRYDLVPPVVVQRYAQLLERGAQHYGDKNWEKGMPLSRYLDSAFRHLYQLAQGRDDEDHAAAVLFNVGAIIHHRDAIALGRLPATLDDLPTLTRSTPSALGSTPSDPSSVYGYANDCPRCGQDHGWIPVERLLRPTTDGFDSWAMCPATSQPIFFAD